MKTQRQWKMGQYELYKKRDENIGKNVCVYIYIYEEWVL